MNLHNAGILKILILIIVFKPLYGACQETPANRQGVNQGNQGEGAVSREATSAVSITATPALIDYNSTSVISWSSTNTTSCSFPPAGIKNTAGSFITPPLKATTVYSITCEGVTGKVSNKVVVTVASAAIVGAANKCAVEPMRLGKVYYYCDCGTGAEAGCVAGNDTNAGRVPSTPRKTIGNAATLFRTLAANDTVALCKGGAFTTGSIFNMGTGKCTAGNACNDLRDYTPTTFAGTAKPIINRENVDAPLFNFTGPTAAGGATRAGGLRILNLKLQAGPAAMNAGISFYRGARDVTMCNLDIDAFNIAVYNESSDGITENIKLTGSLITNSLGVGYLGGGNNAEISYNYWLNNGNSSVFTHTLYFASSVELSSVKAIGNYIKGQRGPICLGVPFVGHFPVDGFQVRDNVVDIAASETSGGCWGIALTNLTGNPAPVYMRNTVISGNTIKNGGNLALTVTGCPGCVIENNVIINETAMSGTGIGVATLAKRANTLDLVNERNIIRNNTIWYGPNANMGGTGISVGAEGSGHIIANNTVTYSTAVTVRNGAFNCFSYSLSTASYAFINNNHCYVPSTAFKWEATRGTLAAWQAYSVTLGFDSASISGLDPKFKIVDSAILIDLANSNSPLKGKGVSAHKALLDINGKKRASPPAIGAYEY